MHVFSSRKFLNPGRSYSAMGPRGQEGGERGGPEEEDRRRRRRRRRRLGWEGRGGGGGEERGLCSEDTFIFMQPPFKSPTAFKKNKQTNQNPNTNLALGLCHIWFSLTYNSRHLGLGEFWCYRRICNWGYLCDHSSSISTGQTLSILIPAEIISYD